VCDVGRKCPLHKNIATYLLKSYSDYYGSRQHHHAIISSKKHKLEYQDAVLTDAAMCRDLKEEKRRQQMYGQNTCAYKNNDRVRNQSPSTNTSWYGYNKNANSSKINTKYKSDESKNYVNNWNEKVTNQSTGWVKNDLRSSRKWGVTKNEVNKIVDIIDIDMSGDDNTNSTQPTYASGFDSNTVYSTTVNHAAMPRDTVMKRNDPPREVGAIKIRTQPTCLQLDDCAIENNKIKKSTSNYARAFFKETIESLEKAKKIEDEERIRELKIQWPCMQTKNRYGESFSLTECERYVKNKINQKTARRDDLSRKREEYRLITIVRDLTTVFIRAVNECT
jgi:hypothetical protein